MAAGLTLGVGNLKTMVGKETASSEEATEQNGGVKDVFIARLL